VKLLLDTHTFLWLLVDPEKLPFAATEAISNPDNEPILSIVSLWEIAIKTAKATSMYFTKAFASCIGNSVRAVSRCFLSS